MLLAFDVQEFIKTAILKKQTILPVIYIKILRQC